MRFAFSSSHWTSAARAFILLNVRSKWKISTFVVPQSASLVDIPSELPVQIGNGTTGAIAVALSHLCFPSGGSHMHWYYAKYQGPKVVQNSGLRAVHHQVVFVHQMALEAKIEGAIDRLDLAIACSIRKGMDILSEPCGHLVDKVHPKVRLVVQKQWPAFQV